MRKTSASMQAKPTTSLPHRQKKYTYCNLMRRAHYNICFCWWLR